MKIRFNQILPTTETAYTLPLRFFFSGSFPFGPVASSNTRDLFGASQTFHVLPYLDRCTLRVNHFLTKVYQMLKKGLFHLGPYAAKVKMRPVKPILLRLKVLGWRENIQRQSYI